MKTLIITGASSGIGLATARAFLEQGCSIINLSRRECPLDAVRHIPCDLADPEQRTSAMQALASKLPDTCEICLVHNAGALAPGSMMETDEKHFRRTIEINLVAPHLLNMHLLPRMSPGSSIIYLGSTLSEVGVPGAFAYVTTRHGTLGMMRAACQDLVGTGIHTACVCPGFTDTDMLRTHLPDDAVSQVATANAFGRLVAPQEIAACVQFVAGQPSLNGSVLHANLGQIQR